MLIDLPHSASLIQSIPYYECMVCFLTSMLLMVSPVFPLKDQLEIMQLQFSRSVPLSLHIIAKFYLKKIQYVISNFVNNIEGCFFFSFTSTGYNLF